MATTPKPVHHRKRTTHKTQTPVVTPLPVVEAVTPPLPSKAETTPLPPVRPAPVLIKKTYNQARLRYVYTAGLVVVTLMAIGVVWYEWPIIMRSFSHTHIGLIDPPIQLKITHKPINQQKAKTALEQASLSASRAAAPEGGTTTVVPLYEGEMASLSTVDLYAQLDARIDQLNKEKLNTRVYQNYSTQAKQAANDEATRKLLMEGIQAAKERQALYGYYGK